MGAAAGPVGAVAGVVIGGIAGALAAKAMDNTASREAEHERALDAELGVSEGDLGVAPENHKPTGE